MGIDPLTNLAMSIKVCLGPDELSAPLGILWRRADCLFHGELLTVLRYLRGKRAERARVTGDHAWGACRRFISGLITGHTYYVPSKLV